MPAIVGPSEPHIGGIAIPLATIRISTPVKYVKGPCPLSVPLSVPYSTHRSLHSTPKGATVPSLGGRPDVYRRAAGMRGASRAI